MPTEGDVAPPTVILSGLPAAPINAAVLEFSGRAEDADGVIASLGYSLDGGTSWHPVTAVTGLGTRSAQFRVITVALEDGTYHVLVRARDAGEHEGRSAAHEVTIDRLPPLLGSFTLSLEDSNLQPKGETFFIPTQNPVQFTVSLLGGVTGASITVAGEKTALTPFRDGRLWSGTLTVRAPGVSPLELSARDGAGREFIKILGSLDARSPLTLVDRGTAQPIREAFVTFERLDALSGRWSAAGSRAAPHGVVSAVVSQGTWRLAVTAPGYERVSTQPFEIRDRSPLFGTVILSPRRTRLLPQLAAPVQGVGVALGPDREPSVSTLGPARIEPESVPASVEESGASALASVTFRDVDDRERTLEEWRGRPVLLTSLAMWNRASAEQLAVLAELQNTLGDHVVVLPLFAQHPRPQVRALLERGGYGLTGLLDETGQEIQNLPSTFPVPAHFLIDRRGALRAVRTGFAAAEELSLLVRRVSRAAPLE